MNCIIGLIGISLTLVAIVAGMQLLAKTQKENLGRIYKAVSYFVIIAAFASFLLIACGSLCMHIWGHKADGGCIKMQHEKCMHQDTVAGEKN